MSGEARRAVKARLLRLCAPLAHNAGAPLYVSDFAVPKNAQNKAATYAYLDAMLDPSAQIAFGEPMGYNPTVDNAKLPEAIAKRVAFTKEEQVKLVTPNYEYIAKNDAVGR